MKTLRLTAHVDQDQGLTAHVPSSVPPGPVEVLLRVPTTEEDEASAAWMEAISREWLAELSDPREDIYTLEDGEPPNGPR
jgi:hypothetical protein